MGNKLLTILKGRASKKVQGIYILFIMLLLIILWGTAQLLFEGQYSIFVNTISNQGRTDLNPHGWYFFTAGTISVGLGLIPHFLYLYHNLKPHVKILLILAIISGIYASIGFVFVGIIPGNIYKPGHSFAAQSAFNGFYVSAALFLLVFLIRFGKKEPQPKLIQIILVYLLFFLLLFLAAIVPDLDQYPIFQGFDPRIFSGSLWQWIGFLNVFIWLFNLYFIVPNKWEK
jgi:hypothetical protein